VHVDSLLAAAQKENVLKTIETKKKPKKLVNSHGLWKKEEDIVCCYRVGCLFCCLDP
jgi:hypothetical protein